MYFNKAIVTVVNFCFESSFHTTKVKIELKIPLEVSKFMRIKRCRTNHAYLLSVEYLKFDIFHLNFRDAVGLVCMDTFTSSLAGFVIFSVLGFMSQKLGVDIGKVVESGKSVMIFNILVQALLLLCYLEESNIESCHPCIVLDPAL